MQGLKKILNSGKFWAITIGIIIGSLLYWWLGDDVGLSNTFPMLVVGAYSTVAALGEIGKSGEKIMKSRNNNGDNSENQQEHIV